MKKCIFLFLLIIPLWLSGQDYEKRIYTTTRISTPPAIDGELDDEAWSHGEWGGDFFQYEPSEAAPVKQKTEFKVLYDDNNIYVAIKAYDTAPDSIMSRMTRRDDIDGDQVVVAFDSYHDLQTGFVFVVNAAGVKNDFVWVSDGQSEDDTWDPI